MKRWIWLLCGILTVQLFGAGGTELEQLKPVETLFLSAQDGSFVLMTDTGDRGKGKSFPSAVEDLRKSTAGKIFLETAENLILTEETLQVLPELNRILRPGVRLCLTVQQIDPVEAGNFLKSHPPVCTLKQRLTEGEKLPVLTVREGRYRLAGEKTD